MPLSSTRKVSIDPGWLLVLLLGTLAAWPLIMHSGPPAGSAAEAHIDRTMEIIAAWGGQLPFVSWLHGHGLAAGQALIRGMSPLAYGLAAAYGSLSGGPAAGIKFVLVLAAYAGPAGMYLFVRERWGAVAGLVSASAFGLAPYVIFITPQVHGDAPEALAIALAPLVLWAFARLRRTASPGDAALSASLLAALILSHSLMAVIFFGMLAAWLAWDLASGHMFFGAWVAHGGAGPADVRRKVMLALAGGVTVGVGLAAFMWLPALAQRTAIEPQAARGAGLLFVEVHDLFAAARGLNGGPDGPHMAYTIGVAQAVLAALGVLTVFWPRLRRLSVLFFSFAALACLYMILPASKGVWEAVPLLAVFQFPTRFLGPAAVVLGVLAGAGLGLADMVPWRWSRLAMASMAITAILLGAMPLLGPTIRPDAGAILPVQAAIVLELAPAGLRRAAWAVSVLSLAGLLALAKWQRRLRLVRPEHDPLATTPGLVLGLVLVTGLTVRLAADHLPMAAPLLGP
jgi:hypothetical protein